jgi:RHS repeat-associated protein
MPGRKFNTGDYRMGFNGKENDREWGNTLIQDYGFRLYNPAIAKFLSVDPLTKSYPMLTPYQFASNRPIDGIDLDGLEHLKAIVNLDKGTTKFTILDSEGILKVSIFLAIDDAEVFVKEKIKLAKQNQNIIEGFSTRTIGSGNNRKRRFFSKGATATADNQSSKGKSSIGVFNTKEASFDENLDFVGGSGSLVDESSADKSLDQYTDVLQKNSNLELEVIGHTGANSTKKTPGNLNDPAIGGQLSNDRDSGVPGATVSMRNLALRRAGTIKGKLEDKGVPADQVTTSAGTHKTTASNRKIEFKFKKKG